MKVTFYSSKGYSDPTKNNGDCILIDNGAELVIYDCGCEEHAKRVCEYMDNNGCKKLSWFSRTMMLTILMESPI